MTTEKRVPLRHKKRFSVRFGVGETNRIAFTEDLSVGGLFIKTLNVLPPNTKIILELELDDAGKILLNARVMWARKVPNNLFHLAKKAGMGVRIIRFINGEEEYRKLCNSLSAR